MGVERRLPVMKKINVLEPKQPTLKPRKRVAAYARVSMETERLKHSLSAQVSYYSALIQKNPEWIYAGVYADDAISGTGTEKRSEFNRLIADCDAGLVNIVLVKSISRFARNTVDLLNTVRHLKDIGVDVWFEDEGIHSLDGDGELMLTILASFAQEESRSISENCKWGIRKQYERGEGRGCKIYGYRAKKGQLVIQEDEAAVVRRIFQLFLAGDSCYVISKKLEAEGVRSYAGKRLCGEVIAGMIRQEKYTGCTLGQKFFAENHVTHKPVRNNGELPMYFIEETHPAIISMETFQAAQQEFAQRYGVEIKNGIAQRASYLYHPGGESEPHPKHRAPQWSEERRKAHSEYFRTRECGLCRYDFSHFIECEHCGGHMQASLKHYVDGSTEVGWVDVEHTMRAKDTPRPLVLRDSALKKQIASALGWEAFDADRMFETLSGIGIDVDMITLHFKDGSIKRFRYIQPKQIHRKRKETT